MSFPLTYSGSIEFDFNKDQHFSRKTLVSTFYDRLKRSDMRELASSSDQITFVCKQSLFNIPYPVHLKMSFSEKVNVMYKIQLHELVKFTTILAVLCIFFSKLSFGSFLLFTSITVILFFLLNLMIIKAWERTPFPEDKSLDGLPENIEDGILRCPACGYEISEYDNRCPGCKLNLHGKGNLKFVKTDATSKQKIVYEIKTKKNE
ncbi:MAG: hypothetical protein NTW49_14590 [Bacteroidia bacterium]|nr:hypothetical protein [Bacteroidia bacterium]